MCLCLALAHGLLSSTGASAGPDTACCSVEKVAGPKGQSSLCAPRPGFPRGGGFSLCFCPHPTSVLLPVTCRGPGGLAPSPQLHLGRRRGGSLHVCKTQALFHTPLTSLGKGGGGAGGRARRLSWLLAEHPTTRRAQGDESCQHRGTCQLQHKEPLARETWPSTGWEPTLLSCQGVRTSHITPESPVPILSCTPVLHSQDSPFCTEPTRGDAILPSIAAPY